VAYISPNFSGFNVIAAYSTDFTGANQPGADKDDADVYNLNATYSNGPLYLGLAYGDGNGHESAGLGAQWRAAAGYTFGNFKIVGQYDSLEDDSTTVGTQNGDYDAWMLGASYTMGAMVFKGNYMAGEFDGTNGAEPEQWTVGMDYNLSKRTSVYALYADGDSIVLGGGAGSSDLVGSGAANGDVNAFSMGVTHAF